MYRFKFAKSTSVMAILFCFLQTFSFSQGIWTQKTSLTAVGREDGVALSINNKGYFGTGYNGPFYSDWWEYNPATDSWTQKASLPIPVNPGMGLRAATSFAIGNKGYVCMGGQLTGAVTDLWEYDVTLNSWTQKSPFPQNGRIWCSSFSIGNKGYVGLGDDGSGLYSDFYEYDQASDSWSQIAFFGVGNRENAFAFTIQNKAYVGGGGYSAVCDDFWEYEPVADIWTQKANIIPSSPSSANLGFAISTINKGYMKRGFTFRMYDPNTNAWSVKTSFPGGTTSGAASFSIGNKGYIACGGDNFSNYYNQLWEYTPDTASGIEELEKLEASIYPNPNNGNFSISINEKEFNVTVYDVTGKMIYQNKNEKQINLTDKPKGIYLLKIQSDNKIYSQKIII